MTFYKKLYVKTIHKAQCKGYNCVLLFFWLRNHNITKEMVKHRVLMDDHNVDDSVIERQDKRRN
jgi:predicted ABC-type ATPase